MQRNLGQIKGPKGDPGKTPKLRIGTVQPGAAGTDPVVTMTESGDIYTLNFTIPRGQSSGGDMAANVYDTHGRQEDIFDYIEGFGVTTDGATFTGAIILRDGAPEEDDEAVPKSYSDSGDQSVIDAVNGFIRELNDSECVIKRDEEGKVLFNSSDEAAIVKAASYQGTISGAFEYAVSGSFAISSTGEKKRYYIKIKSVTSTGDNILGKWYLRLNNQDYQLTANAEYAIETPNDSFYLVWKTNTSSGSGTIDISFTGFSVIFEDREAFDEIGD